MVAKLNPIKVEKVLKSKGLFIFTPLDFQRLFGVSRSACRQFLTRHSKKDFITKLRAGLYSLADNPPSEYLIANKLYQPSYISLECALSYYGIIPEAIYTITSVTPKATRKFEAQDLLYTYRKIKREAFCGYHPQKIRGETILIAEPEKALVDYLYFIDREKEEPNERLYLKKLSKKKILSYIKLFKRKSLNKLIKKIYDFSILNSRIYQKISNQPSERSQRILPTLIFVLSL
jgi:predicted transcriptional regulator of viral defense system